MAYATIAEYITYSGHTSDFTSDLSNYDRSQNYDAANNAIARAQTIIETLTSRVFETSEATRYFDVIKDVDGLTLLLDEDLVWDSDVVVTNGAGGTVSDADYVLEPRNGEPQWGLTLLGSTGLYWQESSAGDAENAISVKGDWGFSTTAPNDIKQATLRLAKWLYKQRNSSVDSDVPIVTPQGVLVLPGKLPADVMALIASYVKPRVRF